MRARRWITNLARVSVLTVLIGSGLGGCGARGGGVSAVVPGSWTMTGGTGSIARLCFGSWEECGAVKRTYATHSDPHGAMEDLARGLHRAGWTVEAVDGSRLSAFAGRSLRTETARLDAEIRDGRASITYVHR